MGVSRTKAMETFPWPFLLSINNCGLSCGSMLKPELAGRQLPGKVIGRAGTGLPSYPQQGYRDTGASPGGDNVRLNTSGLGVCAGMDGRFGSVLLPVLAHTHAHIHACARQKHVFTLSYAYVHRCQNTCSYTHIHRKKMHAQAMYAHTLTEDYTFAH